MKIMARFYLYLVSTCAAALAEGGAFGATGGGDAVRWLAPDQVQAVEMGLAVPGGGGNALFPGPEPLVMLCIGSALVFFGIWRWRKGVELEAQSGKGLPRWKR